MGASLVLKTLLENNKGTILKKWIDKILETHSKSHAVFVKNKKDQFANPIGHVLTQETKKILDAIINDQDLSSISESLDKIMKIRSIQDYSPASAVAFVFVLKEIIRNEFEKELNSESMLKKYMSFENRIDELSLMVFNSYVKCRDKIFELRLNEIKKFSVSFINDRKNQAEKSNNTQTRGDGK